MTLKERAREIINRAYSASPKEGDAFGVLLDAALVKSITEALRTVRNEALEEAAKVATKSAEQCNKECAEYRKERDYAGSSIWSAAAGQSNKIAKAIRSLKESP